MRKTRMMFWGVLLVVAGLVFFVAELFHISGWAIFWPVLLIGVGVWMLMRPRMVEPGTFTEQNFIGEIRRRGQWKAENEDITNFVGDVDLDLTHAEFPNGEAHYRVTGFVGDVDVLVPPDVGVQVNATGFVNDVRIFGEHLSHFLEPIHFESPNFTSAEKKFYLESSHFVGDIKVERVG